MEYFGEYITLWEWYVLEDKDKQAFSHIHYMKAIWQQYLTCVEYFASNQVLC